MTVCQSTEPDTLMTTRRKKKMGSVIVPPPRKWSGTRALAGIRLLNEHFLEALTAMAKSERQCALLPLISQHRNLWNALDAAARKRAAGNAVLLLDLYFHDADAAWWQESTEGGKAGKKRDEHSGLPSKRAAELVRETLMLACPTVREDQGAAIVLFGMSKEVGDRRSTDSAADRSHRTAA